MLMCTGAENLCPELPCSSGGIVRMTLSLIYGYIERRVVYIERASCVIQSRVMATKNDCRRVIGEENLVGG